MVSRQVVGEFAVSDPARFESINYGDTRRSALQVSRDRHRQYKHSSKLSLNISLNGSNEREFPAIREAWPSVTFYSLYYG